MINPNKQRTRKGIEQVKTLADLCRLLAIEHYDCLIAGDGSATRWEYACGWASVLICNPETIALEKPEDAREVFFGAVNHGTNIFGELMAYLHPLMYLNTWGLAPGTRIHCVTDCEILVGISQGQYQPKVHAELWMILKMLRRKGLIVKFHWIPRDKLDLNKLCHNLANAGREWAKGYDVRECVRTVRSKAKLRSLNP